jgi:hypothetical protein
MSHAAPATAVAWTSTEAPSRDLHGRRQLLPGPIGPTPDAPVTTQRCLLAGFLLLHTEAGLCLSRMLDRVR